MVGSRVCPSVALGWARPCLGRGGLGLARAALSLSRGQRLLLCFRLSALWVGLSLSLAGCSAAGERLVGWYVTRTLDGYFDFSSAQKRAARVQVDQTLELMRQTELPHWVSYLREVRQGIHDGLTEEDIARLQRHYDARLDQSVALLAPRLALMLAQLDAAQLDHFAARMREDVDEQYEELKLAPDERRAAVEKRALDAVEKGVGDLSEAQEQGIRSLLRALPNERPVQYRSARDNIARFRAFMAQRPDVPTIEAQLHTMWEHRYDALGPGRDKTARRSEQRRWLLAVYRMLTPEQREHAEEGLTERIQMLKRFLVTG